MPFFLVYAGKLLYSILWFVGFPGNDEIYNFLFLILIKTRGET